MRNGDWARLMELRQAAGYDDARGNPRIRKARAEAGGKCVMCWAPFVKGDPLVLEGPLPRHEQCFFRVRAAERAVMSRRPAPTPSVVRRRATIEDIERAAAERDPR